MSEYKWSAAQVLRLSYTLPALADLSAILDYFAAYSPQGTKRVQTPIRAIIDLLKGFRSDWQAT
jgi:hypothetical protein